MTRTLGRENISTKLLKIAETSKKAPKLVWTTLAHHIDFDFLLEAYRRTRKDGAAGIDGQKAAEYARQLSANLTSLCERFKSGAYKAPAVRRSYIPKGDGKSKRPIGIPTFEDKVLQRAVVMLLEAVYEQDFLNCSYGFRPGRSAHQALGDLRERLKEIRGGYVVKVDIEKFFDTLDHKQLRSFLDQRVRDGSVRRTIDKWLKAGVMEEGKVRHLYNGTPQGGVISPLLANIYLHEVLDVWFEQIVKPCMKGYAFVIRYADDVILGFSEEYDVNRVLKVLPKRFGKYGLRVHSEKTRIIRFQKPPKKGGSRKGPGSFEFLGFTHYWARHQGMYWVIKRKTAKDRFSRALKRVKGWCWANRHEPLKWQQRQLTAKLKGHSAYYGISGNAWALERFREEVRNIWRKWLSRRSQRAYISWERYEQLLKRFPLPKMRVVHSMYGRAAKPSYLLRSRMR